MNGKTRLWLFSFAVVMVCAFAAQAAQIAATRALGTVTAIAGKTITLKTDVGVELTVSVTGDTKLLQLKPGQKDLKDATPLALGDLKAGDRVLVRGTASEDGKSVQAISLIAMKQSDIADKQAHERAEWQQHGVGGLVKSVDPATGTIAVTTNGMGTNKELAVHTGKETVLRRYAASSVKFDDAKPAPLSEIKAGDQLRARGKRSEDGSELAADEIVSGTFRSIAGILSSVDSKAGTITVTDLATKQPVTVQVTSDSQLRKLQPFVAQGIAMRLKGAPPASKPDSGNAAGNSTVPATTGGGIGRGGSGPGAGLPPGANGQGRAGDFQQMIARMPAASLTDLQKGDAVMIVATEGSANSPSTVITLLGGVEPILQAGSKAAQDMILSPWSLSGGGGEGATP